VKAAASMKGPRTYLIPAIRKNEVRQLRRSFQHWSILVIALAITAVTLNRNSSSFDVQMNAALVSLTLLLSTAFELVGLHIWQDASELMCGAWIAASPYAYAEVGELRYWHLSLGAALAMLATINIWKAAKRVQRK
jgi:hypothetical protein